MSSDISKKVSVASVRPRSSLNLLSHREIEHVTASKDEIFHLFRQCALAVLNTGNQQDDAAEVLASFADFDIRVVPRSRGIKLDVFNAPACAFVDGVMIRGVEDHLISVLRDIVFTHYKISNKLSADLESGSEITDMVFRILRNAGVVKAESRPNLVVCWGGHSISRQEYDYCKHVGYELGLRGMDIATGCGIGAMKGPMKGAVVGHGKQQIRTGRYIGITEPGIIASESPNPTVTELVILPDIEKRLEAFVRLAHCIIVFPGGAGTAEEVLYLLGLLMHPKNQGIPLPIIFAAPLGQENYFKTLDQFIRSTLGDEAAEYYEIIVGEPEQVARQAYAGIDKVQRHRSEMKESYTFSWQFYIPPVLQQPFDPSHENVADLNLDSNQPAHELAAALRCAFSAIVAGNVKAHGIELIEKYGPYIFKGEQNLMTSLDKLLQGFVAQGRMKLNSDDYVPCYKVEK